MKSVNPFDQVVIRQFAEFDDNMIDERITQADLQFHNWKHSSFAERSAFLESVAHSLEKKKEDLALLMTNEMGKPVKEARSEVEKCAWVCRYYAEHGEKFLSRESIDTEFYKSFITYQPLGCVLAIMPWNFPLWQVFRFAAPALMAGNVVVLKHASNVTGCALAIEDIFNSVDLANDLFTTLVVSSKNVKKVIEHPLIRAVTFTGSTEAGRAIAKAAGENLKKTVLELGGSDPYVILEDANIDHAVEKCVTSRLINGGQSCISAKRFIIHQSVYHEFENKILQKFKDIQMGDPKKEETDIGPMAKIKLRDELHKQVTSSIRKGARCLLGGEIPTQAGAFYPPTILTDVKKGMPAFDQEMFGPVAALIQAESNEEAIHLANDSLFGLGSAIFTQNLEQGEMLAELEMEAGACFVNEFVKSDPRMPFGGIKESGYGRELSLAGIREFVNVKSICVAR